MYGFCLLPCLKGILREGKCREVHLTWELRCTSPFMLFEPDVFSCCHRRIFIYMNIKIKSEIRRALINNFLGADVAVALILNSFKMYKLVIELNNNYN